MHLNIIKYMKGYIKYVFQKHNIDEYLVVSNFENLV